MTTSANDVPLSRLGPLLEVIRMAKEAPLAPQRLGGASIFSDWNARTIHIRMGEAKSTKSRSGSIKESRESSPCRP